MKSIKILLWILFLHSISLFAQDKDLKDIYTDFTTAINTLLLTQNGSLEVTGFLSYNHLNTEIRNGEDWTKSAILIEPQLSYFIIDNLALGLQISHIYEEINFEDRDFSDISRQTFIGPLAKFYFGEEQFRPFVFADYLFLTGDNQGSEMDFGAGLFYHVSGNFGLNLFGKYGLIWTDENDIESQNRIFIGIGITNFIL